MRCLEFYFDFSCPYAYIASTQIEALAQRHDVQLSWKPMLLGGVFKARKTPQNLSATMGVAKSQHNQLDMHRWASHHDVPLTVPDEHPIRTVRALRTLLALPPEHWSRFIHLVYEAYWVLSKDISKADVIEDTLCSMELTQSERKRCLSANDEPEIRTTLFERTQEAIDRSVFGVPTMFVYDEKNQNQSFMFWGQDRMELVDAACQGWDPFQVRPPNMDSPATKDVLVENASLDFWFDFSSPYAYLASTQMQRIAETYQVTCRWRPMLLGALFRSIGTPDVPLFAMNQAKQDYMRVDLEHWANFLGVPFEFTSHFPVRTVLPLRVCLAAKAEIVRVGQCLMHALWVDDQKIDDPEVLRKILEQNDFDPTWVDQASAQIIKSELKENTALAVKEGVFGTPTFVLHQDNQRELYWGQDRLPLVERVLSRRSFDR